MNQHSHWADAFKDPQVNVRLFEGEIRVESGKNFGTVYCSALQYTIRYHLNNNARCNEQNPQPMSKVLFAIGVNDHGLWAYGLHTAT